MPIFLNSYLTLILKDRPGSGTPGPTLFSTNEAHILHFKFFIPVTNVVFLNGLKISSKLTKL